jgi:hypothetical protein
LICSLTLWVVVVNQVATPQSKWEGTVHPKCVIKHSSWMNPLALRPENALLQTVFTIGVFATDFSSPLPPSLYRLFIVPGRSRCAVHFSRSLKQKTLGF